MSLLPLRSACLFLLVLGAGVCAAHSQSAAPASTEQNAATKDASSPQTARQQNNTPQKTEQQIEKKEQSQRMLGVVPQFTVTDRRNAPSLVPKEKFHLFVKSAFDPVEFGLVGFQSGLSQAEDEFPEYGQGAAGYGKRYGAAFADQVSSGFFSNYFYPVLFKEDPRYFRLGKGSTMHRVGYALVQEVVCHTDVGGRSFGWSNTLGSLSAGGVSNLYYPENERGFALTMSRAGIAMLYGSLGGLADEFYPDIDRKFIHRHAKTDKTQ
jgi:hypothetical protein